MDSWMGSGNRRFRVKGPDCPGGPVRSILPEVRWVVATALSMITLILFMLLKIFYFCDFLIFRANIYENEKQTDHLYDFAYQLSKFGRNRSSCFRDILINETW